jgi:hypothetical protein
VSALRGAGKAKPLSTVFGDMVVQGHRAREQGVHVSACWKQPCSASSSTSSAMTTAAPASAPPSLDCRPRAPGPDESPDSGGAGNVVTNLLESATAFSEVELNFCMSQPFSSPHHVRVDPMLHESCIKAAGLCLQPSTANPPAIASPIIDQLQLDKLDAHDEDEMMQSDGPRASECIDH